MRRDPAAAIGQRGMGGEDLQRSGQHLLAHRDRAGRVDRPLVERVQRAGSSPGSSIPVRWPKWNWVMQLMQSGVGQRLADLGHPDVARLDQHILEAQHPVPMMIVQHARPHAICPAFAIERVGRLEQLPCRGPRPR